MQGSGLAGKVAIVTGSSSGIGQAIAVELARQGANIILHGRSDSTGLQETAGQIDKHGQNADIVCCEFSNSDAVEKFASDVWSVHKRIDILVNNAGADVLTGDKANLSAVEKLDYLYAVDCRTTFQLSRLIGAKMKQAGRGAGQSSITNIGWDQAVQGMAGESGEYFAAIKGSIMSLTLSLAQSLAPQVRVNCVAPGWIQTQWGQQSSEYWSQRAKSESLMERWGTPTDVANAVTFLVSDQASFISGQVLKVNGGFKFGDATPNEW